MDMFEKSIRGKYRFKVPGIGGVLMVEDLYDLPLQSTKGANLDDLAKALNKQVKESGEESFVDEKSTANTQLGIMLDIVIHIIKVKQAENLASRTAIENKQLKSRIIAKIAEKKDKVLDEKSLDELEKLANAL